MATVRQLEASEQGQASTLDSFKRQFKQTLNSHGLQEAFLIPPGE
jgi:hypothetical protein